MPNNTEQVEGRPDPDFKKGRRSDRAFGNQLVSNAGRRAAVVTAAILLVGAVILGSQIGVTNYESDLTLNQVSESLVQNGDGSCQWIVEFELVNRSDITATITSDLLYLRRPDLPREQIPHGSDSNLVGVSLGPGASVPGRIVVEVPSCPATVDQVKHDPLAVTYDDGSVSQGLSVIEF